MKILRSWWLIFQVVLLGSVVAFLSMHNRQEARADYQASFNGTNFSGLTRQSTIAEYDGTVDDSGNLLDVSGSNYVPYSDAMNSWTVEGGATTETNTEDCPATGTRVADTVNVTNAVGIYSRFDSSAGTKWEPSVYIKRISTSGTLRVQTPEGYTYGYFNVDLSTLPDAWVRLHKGSQYVTAWGTDWVPAGANNRVGLYFLRSGEGTVSFYACGAQLARQDAWRKGPGVYHPTTTVTKPLFDLTPTNSPVAGSTFLQGPDGNLLPTRQLYSDGTPRYYVTAHHDAMYIFDQNVTVTSVMMLPTGAVSSYLFLHGADNARGFRSYFSTAGALYRNLWNKAGDGVTVDGPAGYINDGYYHVFQTVRNNDYSRIGVDGSYGAWTSVATFGIDGGGDNFTLGPLGSATNISLAYFRIDSEALSQDQQNREREKFQGITAYAGGTSFPAHSFTRATTATTEFNNGSLGYVASGVLRVTDGFLSEASATNVIAALGAQRNLDSGWTKYSTSTVLNTGTGPDGTVYLDSFRESADGLHHCLYVTPTLTNGVTYVISALFQPDNRNFGGFDYDLAGSHNDVFWNLTTGAVTYKDVAWTTTGQQFLANGTLRTWATVVGDGTAKIIGPIVSYNGLADAYAGDANYGVKVGDIIVEQGTTPSSVIESSGATRNADVLTIDPFKYEDYVRRGSETMSFNFDQDPAASPVNSNASADYDSGLFSWTASGTKVRETTERYGTYYNFNGSSTRFSRGETVEFQPAATGANANFSIVAAVIPETPPSTYGYIFAKYNTTADREYAIYVNQTGGCTFGISHDGTNPSYASRLTTCYTAGRPLFIAATYSFSGVADAPGAVTGTSTGKLYVNDASVTTDTAFLGPIYDSVADNFIGRSTAGSYFQGKMLWLNWYKGTVLDAATIASMYDQWKQKWLIAPQMGDAGEEMKLYVNFDYKLRAASASAAGDSLVEIGNNYGKSDANSNRISCAALTTTLVCSYWNDTTTATQRTITISGLTQNTWHSVAYYVDLADLANSTMTVDGTAGTKVSMSSSSSVNWRDASIHVGHDHTGAAGFANGWVKNVKVLSKP
jgi:hypothetical protein